MTLLAINAASRQGTFSAVNNELRRHKPPCHSNMISSMTHFDQLDSEAAEPIADSFFADEGIKLQFIDKPNC